MIKGTLVVAGGLAGAVSLSQYPEFSQQYTQRLAGQVDALTEVVENFDRDATASGLTRQEALTQMTGTDFLDDRRESMTSTFARHEELVSNLAALRAASPIERLTMPQKLGDVETLQNTWADYQMAVPVTSAGLISAGVGFVAGGAAIWAVLSVLGLPFRRRRRKAEAQSEMA